MSAPLGTSKKENIGSTATTTGKLPFGQSSAANIPAQPGLKAGAGLGASTTTIRGPSSRYNYLALGLKPQGTGAPISGKPILGQFPAASKRIRRNVRQPDAFRKRRHYDSEQLNSWESIRERYWAGLLYPLTDLELDDLRRTADFEVTKDDISTLEKSGHFVDRFKLGAQRVANAIGELGQKLVTSTEKRAPGLVDKARKGVETVTGRVLKGRDTVSGRLYGPRFKQTWSLAGPAILDYAHPYPIRNTGKRVPSVGWSQSLQTRLASGRAYRRGENTDLSFFSVGSSTDEAWYSSSLEDAFPRKGNTETGELGGHFAGSSASPFRFRQQQASSESQPLQKAARPEPTTQYGLNQPSSAQPAAGAGSPGLRREF